MKNSQIKIKRRTKNERKRKDRRRKLKNLSMEGSVKKKRLVKMYKARMITKRQFNDAVNKLSRN